MQGYRTTHIKKPSNYDYRHCLISSDAFRRDPFLKETQENTTPAMACKRLDKNNKRQSDNQ